MAFNPSRTWQQPKRQQPRWNDEVTSSRTHPGSHKCTVADIDYSRVDRGHLHCTECGRTWELHTSEKGFSTWWPNPCPGCNTDPAYCRHYGKRPRAKKAD